MKRATGTAVLLTLCLLALACSGKPAPVQQTARERDSTLAKSRLPGAAGVGAALRVSESADARRRREDSVSRALP